VRHFLRPAKPVVRVLAAVGLGPVTTRFTSCDDVSFGGVRVALPALLANGMLKWQRLLPSLPQGYYERLHIVVLNDLMGQPYFVISREWNDGLLAALREEIVPPLLKDVPG